MSRQDLYTSLLEQQNNTCAICGDTLPDDRWACRIDRHPVRGEDGGQYVLDNTRLICLDCDFELEGNAPNSLYPMITTAYRSFKLWQQLEGDFRRRIKAYLGQLKGTSRSPYATEDTLLELEYHANRFHDKMKSAEKRMNTLVRDTDEWQAFMKDAPGIGETLAGFLLAKLDMSKARHASSLWSFFGYDPTEDYNPGKGQMKAVLYSALSISVCTRKDSPYRKIYDRYKAEGVSHGGAVYRVIKIWLTHLWATWRKFEGLPTSSPYIIEHGGHEHEYLAEDFGWPDVLLTQRAREMRKLAERAQNKQTS